MKKKKNRVYVFTKNKIYKKKIYKNNNVIRSYIFIYSFSQLYLKALLFFHWNESPNI